MKYVLRPILRMALKRYISKAMENSMHQQQGRQQNRSSKPEGKISVDYIPDNNKKGGKGNSSDGEYVDYEEIK